MEEIKKYSVKIEYKLQGSGVLLKVDEKNSYLITAKHNFKNNDDENYSNVDTSKLKLDNIKISTPNENEVCKVDEIVYEEKKLDLLIFKLKENSKYIKNLPTLQIIKDKHILTNKHFFYGFPQGKESASGELTPLTFKIKKDEKHILSLRGDSRNIYEDDEKGFSGSGVFIKNGNLEDGYIYYLTGIVIQTHEGQSLYETISLSEIIDKINKKLSIPIKVKEDIIDVGFSQNIYTRILNRNKDTYLVKRILEELKNEKKLTFLKNNESNRKEIIKFLDMDKNHLLKLEKELADLYLLKAIIYHIDEKRKDASLFFKKATTFNSRYKNYKLEQLSSIENNEIDEIENNDDFTPLQKAKLYFIECKYEKVIKILTEQYINQLDISEKIESYEYLAKSYEKKDSFEIEESIGYWYKILTLLNESQILEKAEIYYKLSTLYLILNDEIRALNDIEKGLKLLEDDTENNFIEIKYELEKQKKKLLGFNKLDVSNITLTELFKQNPEKYLDEYLESLKNIDIKVTNKDILDEIKVLQKQVEKKY